MVSVPIPAIVSDSENRPSSMVHLSNGDKSESRADERKSAKCCPMLDFGTRHGTNRCDGLSGGERRRPTGGRLDARAGRARRWTVGGRRWAGGENGGGQAAGGGRRAAGGAGD